MSRNNLYRLDKNRNRNKEINNNKKRSNNRERRMKKEKRKNKERSNNKERRKNKERLKNREKLKNKEGLNKYRSRITIFLNSNRLFLRSRLRMKMFRMILKIAMYLIHRQIKKIVHRVLSQLR